MTSQFFTGPSPAPFSNPDINTLADPHGEYCDILSAEVDQRFVSLLQGDQVPLGGHAPPSRDVEELVHIHQSNCDFRLKHEFASGLINTSDPADFRPALLQFMIAATPKDDVVTDILKNFDAHIKKMSLSQEFAPSEDGIQFWVDNVPDAVAPVKAKMAYVQMPNKEGKMELNLVWKVRYYQFPSSCGCSECLYHSSRLKCKTIGMRLLSPQLRLIGSFRLWIGLPTPQSPSRRLVPNPRPTTSSHGVLTTPARVSGKCGRRASMFWRHPSGGTPFPSHMILRCGVSGPRRVHGGTAPPLGVITWVFSSKYPGAGANVIWIGLRPRKLGRAKLVYRQLPAGWRRGPCFQLQVCTCGD